MFKTTLRILPAFICFYLVFSASCTQDKLLKNEFCPCDTTLLQDCWCDEEQPATCTCDTTPYIDCFCDSSDILCENNLFPYDEPACECDSLDPKCPCDTTPFRDCDCDYYHPDYKCGCNITEFTDKGCACDTLDPECECDISAFNDKECPCDVIDPACECDTSEFNEPDCPCDESDPVKVDNKVSYSKDIQPIWNKYCMECHYTGSETPDLTEGISYNKVVPAYIYEANLKLSTIYTQVNSGAMPDGKDRIPQKDIDKILQWLEEGYPDN